MLALTLPLFLLLKQNIGYKLVFAHNVMFRYLCVKFRVTLEFFRRHGKRQIKHFDFGAEYKPNGRKYSVVWKKSTSKQALRF